MLPVNGVTYVPGCSLFVRSLAHLSRLSVVIGRLGHPRRQPAAIERVDKIDEMHNESLVPDAPEVFPIFEIGQEVRDNSNPPIRGMGGEFSRTDETAISDYSSHISSRHNHSLADSALLFTKD